MATMCTSTAARLRRCHPLTAVWPPIVAVAGQAVLARWIGPYIWLLLFPALFITSWMATRRAALVITALSTAAAWWMFVPPVHAWIKAPLHLVDASVVLATGVLFVTFHDRLRRSTASLAAEVDRSRVFEAFLANSSDFVSIAGADDRPVYLNDAGRRMVELPDTIDIGATSMADYFPADQRAFARDVIAASTLANGEWRGSTYLRNWRTGAAVPVSHSHFLIRDPASGRRLGLGTITRDVTEMRAAQEAIEQSNRRLEQANDEITRLYAKLETVDELKTQFFANVSHELRTPLTLILGPVEQRLAQNGALDADLRRDLEVVGRNARTVLRHVNDLLDVARLDAGRLSPEYSGADAAALVAAVAAHFTALAREQRIAFVVESPGSVPIQTDAPKLQRMVLNLVSNAFKFTPADGRVRLTLLPARDRLVVEVADSGPGIPEDERQAVFERFRHRDPSAAAVRDGVGLGLSIVREFATLLGGSVSVTDAPEGGALFILDLPVAAPADAVVAAAPDVVPDSADAAHVVDALRVGRSRPAPSTGNGGLGRIVVAEDDRDMSQFIVDNLTADGFAVSVAYDGREAYDAVLAERPDLLLADVMMPVLTGDELVRRLRELPELESLPIVVLTARADEAMRVRLLTAGAQDYLDKPFSVAELRARVRNLVAHKRAEDRLDHLRRQLEAVSRASLEISEAVAGLPEESMRTVFQTIALNARSLTGAEFAAAGIGGDDEEPFEVWAAVGITDEVVTKIGRTPRPRGLLRAVRSHAGALRLRDVRDHPAYTGVPPHHPEIRSFIGVPIRYRSHGVGMLYVANKRGAPEFTAEDAQVAEMLALRAGAAVEAARLYASEGRAHSWLQAVIDQMPEGIVLADAKGRVTLTNRSLRTLTDVVPPISDRFGNMVTIDLRRPSGERVTADDFPIVRAIAAREVTHGDEYLARRADGQLAPVLVSAAPILTADGSLAGAAMIFQEISTLKELERLRQEWATIVAHDLRQPIGAIVLRSDALLRQPLDDDQRKELAQISRAAQRLSRMVSDLMDASLLDSRRVRLVLAPLDVGELLHDIVERVPSAGSRTRLRVPRGDHLTVRGDAQRLEQVIGNLLSNAVKYAYPHTTVVVDAKHADGHAEIVVRNRGAGIPPEELPHIFDRYVRSRAVQGSATTGLGLGLYIAKGLVEAHGGRIWADSVPGQTTSFHVSLPLAESP